LAELGLSDEESFGDGASEKEVAEDTFSKAPAPSFEPWEIDDILSRAYRWFISIPSSDRMRKRFRNPLLEKLLVLGEAVSLDGEVLEQARDELRKNSEGLEWRGWYLLYRNVEKKVFLDRLREV